MKIKKIDPQFVNAYWPFVEDWIEETVKLSNGRHTAKTVNTCVKQGSMEMFLIKEEDNIKAVYVTQHLYYPATECLLILICGGSKVIKHVKEIQDFFIDLAKQKNCSHLELLGRKGWEKVIHDNDLNFKLTGYFYEMAT